MNIFKINKPKQGHRRFVFLSFLFLLFVGSANLEAQNRKITLSLEKVSLRQLFNAIEKQTDYKFLYRDLILDDLKDLSVNVEGKEISTVLDQVLPGSICGGRPGEVGFQVLRGHDDVWHHGGRGIGNGS